MAFIAGCDEVFRAIRISEGQGSFKVTQALTLVHPRRCEMVPLTTELSITKCWVWICETSGHLAV